MISVELDSLTPVLRTSSAAPTADSRTNASGGLHFALSAGIWNTPIFFVLSLTVRLPRVTTFRSQTSGFSATQPGILTENGCIQRFWPDFGPEGLEFSRSCLDPTEPEEAPQTLRLVDLLKTAYADLRNVAATNTM